MDESVSMSRVPFMRRPSFPMRLFALLGIFCGAQFFSSLAVSAPEQERVSLNFVNADIEEVVKAVSVITGRNFLIDPRVKGTINIVSSTPVPTNIAYDILLSALRLQGFAAVESGGITKVMPEAEAKLHIGTGSDTRDSTGDKLVTRVYMLKYESAAQLVPVLRPLIAPNNIVTSYPGTNALVITDYASNLKRIEKIVNSIDQPNAEGGPVIIPLQRASAMDVAQTITRLMQDGGASSGAGTADASMRFVLAADPRTNSLLLRTDNPSRVARVRDLAEKLDIETGSPGNMHVVYLKNAEATKLAQTLRAVMSGDVSAPATAVSLQSSGQVGSTPVSSNAPAGAGIIQADAASNALIITAPSATYNNLRAVIEMLDVRRAQVFVEALIVEVTADKAAEFGVQWQAVGGQATGTQVGGGTNFGGAGTNIIGVAGSIANGTPVIGAGLNIGLLRGQNLGILARALETEANANILSTPNLLTLDNEEAKIIIGQNVPFITGSYAQTGNAATASPFQTIERKDVGLTLRIKPQISESGVVKLQVYQEVSSVQNQTVNNAAGVITNKRSLESTVLVDEGQIVVLGGLIQDSVTYGEDKVPLLGDIPFLGSLFRYETRRRTKTNLMVFIRPYVIRTANASQGLTQDRYDYLRGEQEAGQVPAHLILPSIPAPMMPPLSLKEQLPLSSEELSRQEMPPSAATSPPVPVTPLLPSDTP